MDQAERRKLLERVNRPSATIGVEIPDTITVGEDEIPLDEFVIETRKVAGIPEEAKPVLREAQRSLTAERERLVNRLKTEPLDREEAEEIAATIVGIDRAQNALKSLRGKRFGSETSSAEIDDYKRWLGFLDAIRR